MKPKKLDRKLSLNKKTVATLNGSQMDVVYGGVETITCDTCTCYTVPVTVCNTACVTNCPQCKPGPTADTDEYSICDCTLYPQYC